VRGGGRSVVSAMAALNIQALVAQFLGTAIFVALGCGAGAAGANALTVSLVWGLGFTALAHSLNHYSTTGGYQFNCATTVGLIVAGKVDRVQGVVNIVAQIVGAIVGAATLSIVYPKAKGQLSINSVQGGYQWHNALFGEIFATFFLVFVTLQTGFNIRSKAKGHACLAIGFAIFISNAMLNAVDGCSINPARSFGPAFVNGLSSGWDFIGPFQGDMWVFWLGPILGAAVAGGVYKVMEEHLPGRAHEVKQDQDSDSD